MTSSNSGCGHHADRLVSTLIRDSRRGMLRSTTTALLLLLGACSSRPAAEAGIPFDCGDLRFSAIFQNDSVHLTLPDTVLALPQAISASGARYSDGVATFWEHQGTARLELARDTFVGCRPLSSAP